MSGRHRSRTPTVCAASHVAGISALSCAFRLLVMLPALVLLASCAPEPPRIIDIASERIWLEDLGRDEVYPVLSIFAFIEDPDGVEDVQEMILVHDESGYLWQISGTGMEERNVRDERRLGSSLLVAGAEGFPEGLYRLIVVDRAGLDVETQLALGEWGEAPTEDRFADMSIRGGVLSLRAGSEVDPDDTSVEATVRFVDASGGVREELVLGSGEYQLSQLVPRLMSDLEDLRAWVIVSSDDNRVFLMSGPVIADE